MLPRIDFQRSLCIAERYDLVEVHWQKRGNRSSRLVLIHVTALMRKEPIRGMTVTHVDAVAECKSTHSRTEQATLESRCPEFEILRKG